MTARAVETVVVGAGQAGLLASQLLSRARREHVVLDRRASLGGGWQERWDAFRLVSPNWTVGMPEFPYSGSEPDGFMPRDELIAHWRAYAAAIAAPVELETDVTRLSSLEGGAGARFALETSRGRIHARDVIVAGGPFQRPHVPAMADALDRSILSLHSHDYRRPEALPPGGVLLIGSGQTGVQLAEELTTAGRAVTIAAGKCGWVPRSYRGKDVFWWFRQLATRGPSFGVTLPTPATLPSPAARLACNPQLSGHGGGRTVSLRRLAARGIRIAGRLEGFDGTSAHFRADLGETLGFSDAYFPNRLQARFDAFAERSGEEVPPEELKPFAYEVPELTELDLAAEGIGTVIWTSGYRSAFGWIEFPVIDEFGLPISDGGPTTVPGLSFLGTPWLVDLGSANLIALVRDGEALAATW